jgi:hypothetical protein
MLHQVLYFRKHSRLVDGLKGVDTEEVEDGFDEVPYILNLLKESLVMNSF